MKQVKLEMTKRHPAVIVLEWLLSGGKYSDGDCLFCLSAEQDYCIAADVQYNREGVITYEKVLLKVNGDVRSFIKDCEKLPEEELVRICASMALNKANKSRKKPYC